MKKMLYMLLIATPLCAMDNKPSSWDDANRRGAKRAAIFTGIHLINNGPMYAASIFCPPLLIPTLGYSVLKLGGEILATEAVMYATERDGFVKDFNDFQNAKKE